MKGAEGPFKTKIKGGYTVLKKPYNYNQISSYNTYILFTPGTSELGILEEYPTADGFTYEWVEDDSTDFFAGAYFIYMDGKLALSLSPIYSGGHELPDEIVKAVLDSIIIVK